MTKIKEANCDVILVDDGSSDETSLLAEKSGAAVIKHKENEGKGKAIQSGFQYFCDHDEYDIVIIMDGDGQHDPEEIPKFLKTYQEKDVDMLVGNRMQDVSQMPLDRKVVNYITSKIVSFLAKSHVSDSQCGFRLLNKKLVSSLSFTTSRFDLESEMIIRAGRKGFKISEIYIKTIYQDEESSIRPIRDTVRFVKMSLIFLFRKD